MPTNDQAPAAGHSDAFAVRHVVMVCHGPFDSNSGGHVCHFANGLASRGLEVTVVARGEPAEAAAFGAPRFRALRFEDVEGWLASQQRLGHRAIVHAWTSRQRVVDTVQVICDALGCPYVVHLEDDEHHVTEAFSGYGWAALSRMSDRAIAARVPLAFSRPRSAEPFMARAAGATVIVDTLREMVPAGVPTHLLEPGIDGAAFSPAIPPARAFALREELGIAPGTCVVAYHGNGHITNRRELFSLYAGVLILRRRGHDVRLLRFGKDTGPPLDVSIEPVGDEVAISLGYISRERLIELLKLADIYVQPGRPSRFNDLRFPSKLPEFLALGKPVILPRTNLGLRLAHDREAIALDVVDGERMAAAIERLLADPELGGELGRNGRLFALEHFDWQRNADGLLRFYGEVVAGQREAAS